ncbi:polysaccharide deacetylase family protein [Feifania hominis]|uniref:Polysaccharide deacetylase family protein n=1 Tax=Feifania hominis TaxID=2763660 RepID=A0A926HV41_9FIRM|nr:polysaccharide deacetylase family protein [Feifania hominis]MBC8536600.1 polysaccharide deacetylase family protein [Feifania hominis]
MRRKLCALALTVLLLVLSVCPASADGGWRVLFDDEFYTVPDTTPMVVQDGVVYFPIDEFLEKFSATYIYEVYSGSLTIFRDKQILTMNIYSGRVVTDDKRVLYAKTFFTNGTFYVPVEFLCGEFGASFSLLSDGTPRIVTKSTLTNLQFELIQSTMTSENPGSKSEPSVYVSLRELTPARVSEAMGVLEDSGLKGAFFFSEITIKRYPATVRRVLARGHTVGLTLSDSQLARGLSASSVAAAIESANDAYQKITKQRATLVYIDTGGSFSAQARNRLYQNGYRMWGVNLPLPSSVGGTKASSADILTVLGRVRWDICIGVTNSAESVSMLDAVLQGGGSYRLRPLTQTATPINYQQDIR